MKYLIQKKFILPTALLDAIGTIALFANRFKKKPKVIKKVLFIRLEHIGDMIMATPVFENWKKNYPNCEVHVLCKTLTKPIIESNPFVDKIITYDAPWFNSRETDSKIKFKDIVKDLKNEKYDLIFEMHGDLRNNLLAYLSKSYSIGYGSRGGGFFLNKKLSYSETLHTIDQNLKLIEPFCKKIYSKDTSLYSSKKTKDKFLKLLKKFNLKPKEYIVLNPLSGRPEKDLTIEEINEYLKKLDLAKVKLVVTGSKSQILENKKLLKNKKYVDLTGKTSIEELIELVRNAKLIIAPDTGIIHMAYALKTPFEVKYKTTDSKIWGYENKISKKPITK